MNIGLAAKHSNVNAKTIRYYESIGLIPDASRTGNGYRTYSDKDVETLRFIHHSRNLGFSVKDVGTLLDLWRNQKRASADVKALALSHIKEVDRKIEELRKVRDTLTHLTQRCHGDDRPDCPILKGLAGETVDA
ncbi:MAG: Cu(I)-responsive transcriptional regulator [Alphaproteobacteria bacterium]|jgi:MerR family copper efflux transcriptional regulator|nr:Cu(I)-responsive transcriptional regulator [Alphaproteobacteria bacterium]MCK5621991.1 Cu(I)-responsive transcriptional regulator [Alphaproteobacteria bacterium]